MRLLPSRSCFLCLFIMKPDCHAVGSSCHHLKWKLGVCSSQQRSWHLPAGGTADARCVLVESLCLGASSSFNGPRCYNTHVCGCSLSAPELIRIYILLRKVHSQDLCFFSRSQWQLLRVSIPPSVFLGVSLVSPHSVIANTAYTNNYNDPSPDPSCCLSSRASAAFLIQ